MKSYLITYDLIRPETSPEYSRLFNAIKTLEYWARPVRSVWLVKTNYSRNQIMTLLRQNSDPNDKLLVINITNDWISYQISNDVIAWMKQGL